MLERINTLQARDIQASQRRFGQAMAKLNKAYNLAKTSDYARKVRGDIKLFQSLHGYINHRKPEDLKDPELLDSAIQQILDHSVAPTGLSDIIGISGARSIFDAEFVAHIQGIEQKNLAQAALEELLRGEIKTLKTRNMVRSRKFSEMLEGTLKRYRDGDNEDVQRVIDELLDLRAEMLEAEKRGEDLGLTEPEHAFFEALETDSASGKLGDGILCQIAKELTQAIKDNMTIDWSISERKQAKLRLYLRDILDKFGYPPSEQEDAVRTVMEQAKLNAQDEARD
jgi:type I restriction enzyme R subunit